MSGYKSRKESSKCPVLSEEPPTADANTNNANTNNNSNNKGPVKKRNAKYERNAHFDIGGEEARRSGAAAAGEGAKATEPQKNLDRVTQFRWATLQLGGPAPGFRGTVRGAMAYDMRQ